MTISRSDLKKFSSLNRKSKRIETGNFIVEGVKNCEELVNSDYKILSILISDVELLSKFPNGILISKKEAERISQLKSSSPIIAIAEQKKENISVKDENKIFYLDNVKDPGNLGTIVRTLDWFGYSQLFCSKNSVDKLNGKVIMSSMGSIFRINVHYINFQDLIKRFPNHKTYGTFMKGDSLYKNTIEEKAIIIMGNESNGISKEIGGFIKNKISIPGNGYAESLNISSASAIIINEINRRNLN
jgi:TrmH family RNA methyltransferase